MWTTHRAVGLRQLLQQPLHFVLLQRHVDLDGGMAGDAGGDAGCESFPGSATAPRARTVPGFRAACARRRRQSTPAAVVLTAMVRVPKGSTSKPLWFSSSEISANTAIWLGVSSTSSGISICWRSGELAMRCRRIFSKSTRSCATCWSMIHRPCGLTARMNDSRICPSGFSVASESRLTGASSSASAAAQPLSPRRQFAANWQLRYRTSAARSAPPESPRWHRRDAVVPNCSGAVNGGQLGRTQGESQRRRR